MGLFVRWQASRFEIWWTLKYNNSSNTMQRLTRFLKDIEDIFTSSIIGMTSTKDPMLFCFSNHSSSFSLCTNVVWKVILWDIMFCLLP
jgi:hypothetical protein